MAQHFVCLTFDHDNTSGAISGLTTPCSPAAISASWHGADPGAVRREAITTTWFIPGYHPESYPSCAAAVSRPAMRSPITAGPIGCRRAWREAEEAELIRGNETIPGSAGAAQSYRSRPGTPQPVFHRAAAEHGFVYDSSLMGHDYPYQARDGDIAKLQEPMVLAPTALVEMPISWTSTLPGLEHAHGQSHPARADERAAGGGAARRFHLYARALRWGISPIPSTHVIGRGHRMLILEQLIRDLRPAARVRDRRQAWLSTGTRTSRRAEPKGEKPCFTYFPLPRRIGADPVAQRWG
jgi:hypothetical protein